MNRLYLRVVPARSGASITYRVDGIDSVRSGTTV